MSTKPSVQPMPRERAPAQYQEQNEQRYRSQVDDELAQKFDRRSNLVLGRGKSLVLSSPGGLAFTLSLNDDGIITVTDSAGNTSEIELEWDTIDGRPANLIALTGAEGIVPINNTAAAITGQGVFATGNYYEQSGDPGSVPNGSFWFKTTTSELFIRRSAAWGLVANIVTLSGFTSLGLSDTNVVGFTTGASTYTKTVTATPVGGSGFTYAWLRLFNEGTGEITPDSSTSSAPLFTLGIGLTSKALFVCTATETSTSTNHQAFVYFDIGTI